MTGPALCEQVTPTGFVCLPLPIRKLQAPSSERRFFFAAAFFNLHSILRLMLPGRFTCWAAARQHALVDAADPAISLAHRLLETGPVGYRDAPAPLRNEPPALQLGFSQPFTSVPGRSSPCATSSCQAPAGSWYSIGSDSPGTFCSAAARSAASRA